MSKDSAIDYLAYILIRLIGPIIRSLPLNAGLFIGRRLGDLFYYFGPKHKSIAYANIKTAFAAKLSPEEINKLTKEFYRSFGQNIVEVLFIPLVDEAYINKYITLEGKEHIFEGFKKGKGVILLVVHAGSWEFSNVICANLGFDFNLFIRGQRYPRLNKLLNSYRNQKGCKLIEKQNQTRELIRALKNNQAIGMTADQGGKSGAQVKFFGKYASMSSGAIRLALKYDAALIPAFYRRVKGPYIKVFIEPPLEIKRSHDQENDVYDNLQELVNVFEKYILKYPREYLWSYKIWKYTKEQNILIISDGKTGHLHQSQGLAGIIIECLKDKGFTANLDIVMIRFKNKFSRHALAASSLIAGKYHCQGRLWSLRAFLKDDDYKTLISIKPDIIISCGASVAPVNYLLSRENLAKSIVIMRPSILNAKRFNLVVMSRHDRPEGRGWQLNSQSHRPPERKNIITVEGALNLVNEDYLKGQIAGLKERGVKIDRELVVGMLVGGDTKDFHLSQELMRQVSGQVKACVEKMDAQILATTSRRTASGVERVLKEEFINYERCRLLVIANENNIPEAVGGILALSKIIITSAESISMISEAVNSNKYVIVFNTCGLSRKHRRFLDYFAENKYIYLVEPCNLSRAIEEVWIKKPEIHALKDNLLVAEAVKKIL